MFTGLYPRDNARAVPNFHVRLSNLENLYPNDIFCAFDSPLCFANKSRLKQLSESYSVKAGEQWDENLKDLSQGLKKWIPEGITVNGHPKATGVLDTINSSLWFSQRDISDTKGERNSSSS